MKTIKVVFVLRRSKDLASNEYWSGHVAPGGWFAPSYCTSLESVIENLHKQVAHAVKSGYNEERYRQDLDNYRKHSATDSRSAVDKLIQPAIDDYPVFDKVLYETVEFTFQ